MFANLHTHSEYSLLDGMSTIPELVARARALGQEALAVTDHGALYGALKFYEEARAHDLNPIIGLEAYVAPQSRLEAQSRGADAVPPDAAGAERDRVPQPAAAVVGVAPRGVLLQAAGRSRAAGGARRGADRAVGVPVGRGADGAAGVARRRRAGGAQVVPRRVPGALLRGAAGPRAGAVQQVHAAAGGAGAGARAAAGADQRLTLHRARAGAPARRAAVHRHERDGARDEPDEARGRLVLPQVRAGDAGAAAGAAGGERQHRADRGASRDPARLRADAAAGPRHPGGTDGGRAPARAVPARARQALPRRQRGTARAAALRAGGDRGDGVRRVHPDRARHRALRARAGHPDGGAGLGGGLDGAALPGRHGHRADAVPAGVRTVPEPRAARDAGRGLRLRR